MDPYQLRADYKLIAKAFGRIGSAFVKKGDLTSAIKYFQKSLSEHRTPDVLAKLKEAEKTKSEADRLAYIDPKISAEEREKGNAFFKASPTLGLPIVFDCCSGRQLCGCRQGLLGSHQA
jgi:stress-induced-phosphoprotein 1